MVCHLHRRVLGDRRAGRGCLFTHPAHCRQRPAPSVRQARRRADGRKQLYRRAQRLAARRQSRNLGCHRFSGCLVHAAGFDMAIMAAVLRRVRLAMEQPAIHRPRLLATGQPKRRVESHRAQARAPVFSQLPLPPRPPPAPASPVDAAPPIRPPRRAVLDGLAALHHRPQAARQTAPHPHLSD